MGLVWPITLFVSQNKYKKRHFIFGVSHSRDASFFFKFSLVILDWPQKKIPLPPCRLQL